MLEKVNPFVRRNKKGKLARVKAFSRKVRPKRKIIGEGFDGRIIDLGRNRLRKELKLTGRIKNTVTLRNKNRESDLQKQAANIGIAPKVYSVDTQGFTMQKLKGSTLKKELKEKANKERRQRRLGIKTGQVLKKLHNSQIIHGDLHLDNVYTSGGVKIIDYGMAKQKKRTLTASDRKKDLKRLLKESKRYPYFQEGLNVSYEAV